MSYRLLKYNFRCFQLKNFNLFSSSILVHQLYVDPTFSHLQKTARAHLLLDLLMVQSKQPVLQEEVVTPVLGAINVVYELHSHH